MALNRVTLTQEELKSCLVYDPETGIFVWAKPRSNKAIKGRRAGSLRPIGYYQIRLFDRLYMTSHLAVLYMTGEMPEFVDHVNRIPTDDRWVNLRVCTRSQNQCNRPQQANNTTGLKGVSWHARRRRWFSQIKRHRKTTFLGYFKTPEEAHAAYVRAAEKLHGDFACTT
jgi:hypothetical protein